jgi:hypothetical protein
MSKTYVGNGKAINTQYGELLKLSFSEKDLDVMRASLNEKGYVNLNCNKRKIQSDYGHTHSLTIDDWKPDQKTTVQTTTVQNSSFEDDSLDFDGELPF